MGMSDAAITALEERGLDQMEAFGDISEKDIPSILKELWRNNILICQTTQNYLHALRY